MNNFINCVEIEKINNQLERAEKQKNKLICNIYKEYELYLSFIRNLLCISVEKGINELRSYPSIKDDFLNANELFCLFEKKISKLIYTKMPLITVEQLKIKNSEKNIDKEVNFNSLKRSLKTIDDPKNKFQYEDGFHLEESIFGKSQLK